MGMQVACRLSFAVCLMSSIAFAGNEANPDAVELSPIPVPVSFTRDMDRPVAFDATATVVVECPDAGAVDWLARHFAEWYGPQAPKVRAGDAQHATGETPVVPVNASLNNQPPTTNEAYAIDADSSGVKIAARRP